MQLSPSSHISGMIHLGPLDLTTSGTRVAIIVRAARICFCRWVSQLPRSYEFRHTQTEGKNAAYLVLLPHVQKQGSFVALCWVRLGQIDRAFELSSKPGHYQSVFRTRQPAWYICRRLRDLRSSSGLQVGVYRRPRIGALVQNHVYKQRLLDEALLSKLSSPPTPCKQDNA